MAVDDRGEPIPENQLDVCRWCGKTIVRSVTTQTGWRHWPSAFIFCGPEYREAEPDHTG